MKNMAVLLSTDGEVATAESGFAVSRAVRRIMELTGAHEALAAEREPRTVRSNPSFTERTGCDAPTELYGRTAGKQP